MLIRLYRFGIPASVFNYDIRLASGQKSRGLVLTVDSYAWVYNSFFHIHLWLLYDCDFVGYHGYDVCKMYEHKTTEYADARNYNPCLPFVRLIDNAELMIGLVWFRSLSTSIIIIISSFLDSFSQLYPQTSSNSPSSIRHSPFPPPFTFNIEYTISYRHSHHSSLLTSIRLHRHVH